jgi:TonB family protein
MNRDFSADRNLDLSFRTRKRVFLSVLTGHVLCVLIPFALSFLSIFFPEKRESVISVRLIEPSPPNIEKSAPSPRPPSPEPPLPEPPSPPVVSPPDPPLPAPPVPVPPEPEISKPEPVKTPVEPKKIPAVKVPKETPVKEKKAWKPRAPDQITLSKDIVKSKQRPFTPIDPKEFKSKLMKIQEQCKVSGGSGAAVSSGGPPLDYYERVSAYLYEAWNQPSKMELRTSRPSVSLSIRVDAGGKILSSSVMRASGIPAMDSSVAELLKNLSALPTPPAGAMTLDISLEVTD